MTIEEIIERIIVFTFALIFYVIDKQFRYGINEELITNRVVYIITND